MHMGMEYSEHAILQGKPNAIGKMNHSLLTAYIIIVQDKVAGRLLWSDGHKIDHINVIICGNGPNCRATDVNPNLISIHLDKTFSRTHTDKIPYFT